MSSLHLFNPENDLALASNSEHFTPPKVAVKLSLSASLLPLWYAAGGDYVFAPCKNSRWIDAVKKRYGIDAEVVGDVPEHLTKVMPWGWSLYARRLLLNYGVSPWLLPDVERLEQYRLLSHRRLTISAHREFERMSLPYPITSCPVEVFDVSIIEQELNSGKQVFLKSPWSGSGRGIIDSATAPQRQVLRLAQGVIKHQGSIMMESRFDKVCDLAMLYDIKAGEVTFVGYSLFYNANYSTYSGNMLLTDDEIVARLSRYVSNDEVYATRDALKAVLPVVLGNSYEGPVGVDMLVYQSADNGGDYHIAPCIEVNLRMTMGRVAHELTKRYLYPGKQGVMKIIRTDECKMIHKKPVVSEHRLVEGTQILTGEPQVGGFAIIMSVDYGTDSNL